MNCALKVITEIRECANVLVHCSDGWDRTAQTTSLAMLCLDQHYRSQTGFLKLIQKEWCSFGHKFKTRLALGEQTTGEYSPVFIQWLETVFQVWIQFPTAFEWTPHLLMRLAHEVVANRYGTFLTDSEKERLERVMPNTVSLWSVLLRPEEMASYQNPNYRPDMGVLVPSCNQAKFTIWEAYWFQYHKHGARAKEEMPAPPPPPPREPAKVEASQPAAPEPVPEAAVPEVSPALPLSELGRGGLFSTEEVASTPAQAPPTQVFNDDDDDDIFTLNPKKMTPIEAVVEARESAVPARAQPDSVSAILPDDEQLL